MTRSEKRLLSILKKRSFQRGCFKLASGEVSDYYIDVKTAALYSEGAHLIGEIVYELVGIMDIDAIGGFGFGGAVIVPAIVSEYHYRGRRMDGFVVREQVKQHGAHRWIEGKLPKGSRVVIVDDVITTGGSILKAIDMVRRLDHKVALALVFVDRLSGAGGFLLKNGVEGYRSVFTIRDFGIEEISHAEGNES